MLNQRHVAQVMRVEQPALELILERLEDGFQYTPVASIPTSVTP